MLRRLFTKSTYNFSKTVTKDIYNAPPTIRLMVYYKIKQRCSQLHNSVRQNRWVSSFCLDATTEKALLPIRRHVRARHVEIAATRVATSTRVLLK